MNNIHIVSVASHHTKGLQRLIDTSSNSGASLHILGFGLPYLGHGSKQLGPLDYIIRYAADDDVIAVIDGYDVVLLSSTEELLKKFYSFNSGIVFGAELNCWPDKYLMNCYPASPTPFRYLNGGGYIGYARSIRKMLYDLMFEADWRDDQLYCSLYFLKYKNDIVLDYSCEIFQSLYGYDEKKFKVDNGRFLNIETRSQPCFIHGNGDLGLEFLSQHEESFLGVRYGKHNEPAQATDFPSTVKFHTDNYNEALSADPFFLYKTKFLRKVYGFIKRRRLWPYFIYKQYRDFKRYIHYKYILFRNRIANIFGTFLAVLIRSLPILKSPIIKILNELEMKPVFKRFLPGLKKRLIGDIVD